MQVPEELHYTAEHEWVRSMGDNRHRLGITDYAQDQLGDVVFVELPAVGRELDTGDLVVEIESTKSVGEVYSPCPGVVTAVNEAVTKRPDLVNTSPYDDGWLIEINGAIDSATLLDASAYRSLTE
ncbi:MAG: glycine cleavage system protein GcvH [Actinobacteria bacterium]|nr:glycine cleavage system protein GcvH [Actinomycetota bacterium]MCI0543139.1 glycine cleavage system protein GcvH [Actinomycetota bacterium]MCI0678010.1 glycine cleavage system protein GcvH [Actinomycetota bacterium]